ncbi:MAG: RraA family protein [Candidatus Rokubacteria bacterium]|nr:RraA family protein [Candidatus Rokubacteria bacterium]
MTVTDDTRPLNSTIDRPAPELIKAYAGLSPNELCDVLELSCVMRYEIRPLWPNPPRIAGPAFTIRTGKHDNLMFHAAIYLAKPGDVIVVEAGDDEMAVAGGNVCAIAQRNGVAGLVVDGVIRDVVESREHKFPVYGRGVSPIPAKRVGDGGMNVQIRCGGVVVNPGDVVVADEEGIVVVPRARAEDVRQKAQAKVDADAKLSLDDWMKRHRGAVETALKARGYRLN